MKLLRNTSQRLRHHDLEMKVLGKINQEPGRGLRFDMKILGKTRQQTGHHDLDKVLGMINKEPPFDTELLASTSQHAGDHDSDMKGLGKINKEPAAYLPT